MSRKINFRAWDKKNKYMFYAGSLSGVGDFYMARYEDKTCDGEEFYNRFSGVDYEWLQGTGMQSANNRDIFDGDIVKDDSNIAIVRFGKYQANNNRIYSNEVAYGFYLEYLSHKGVIDHATKLEYYDVIGNIYENPELIS